ncbi:DHHA1 domain-containing protein [Kitasatospora sp. NPDC096147]|uniref:DHHA1 domain-containing protein n=1 Tax=Kitasatospora sp. NPDC096147 TaxID=3364093 RepID=UPI0038187D4D
MPRDRRRTRPGRGPRAEIPDRIQALTQRLKAADQEAERLRRQAVTQRAAQAAPAAEDIGGVLLARLGDGGEPGEARQLAQAVRERLPAGRPGVVAVTGTGAKGGQLVVTVNDAARRVGLSAADLVRELPGGRGGGTADTAQGGGLDPARLTQALDRLPAHLADRP